MDKQMLVNLTAAFHMRTPERKHNDIELYARAE